MVRSDQPEVLETYRARYESRPPQRASATSNEDVHLSTSDGVEYLHVAPCEHSQHGEPPLERGGGTNTHLWVIDEDGIPYILEQPAERIGQSPKHTNLAMRAHAGGELWFRDSKSITISGGSGRFPPRSAEELELIAEVFRSYEYKTQSLGWDAETQTPLRHQQILK